MGTIPTSAAPWLLPIVLSQLQPEVVEPLPPLPPEPPAIIWLNGQASLVGGQYTSSLVQFTYAEEKGLSFLQSESDYFNRISSGNLVRLESPYIRSIARRPYVLPSTYRFIERLATAYHAEGCGRLTITSASRLISERPSNGSPYSVHPTGMAVDVRVNGIGETCERWLDTYLLERERLGEVDATREWRPPHYHLVVPLEVITPPVQLASTTVTYTDQGN